MYRLTKLVSVLTLSLIFAFGLMGCGGGTTTENKPPANTTKPADNKPADNKTADNKTADNKTADNKTADNSKPADTAGGDKVGVPECDEYIEKYEACLKDKVPEASRAAMKDAFEKTRKAWKDAAATPQGKAGLATGCKAAVDAAKQSMGAYGCKW